MRMLSVPAQITKFLGPKWGPPGSCRPQIGPMLALWTLLSGNCIKYEGFKMATRILRCDNRLLDYHAHFYWSVILVFESIEGPDGLTTYLLYVDLFRKTVLNNSGWWIKHYWEWLSIGRHLYLIHTFIFTPGFFLFSKNSLINNIYISIFHRHGLDIFQFLFNSSNWLTEQPSRKCFLIINSHPITYQWYSRNLLATECQGSFVFIS